MKVVLVMFKDTERREFPLTGDKTVLGRRRDCGLRIPTSDVSRQHCEIVPGPGGLVVRDLGSSNGTFVNGKRVAESPLGAGDRLTVGPVTFVVQIDGKPAHVNPKDAAIEPIAGKSSAPTVTPRTGPSADDETEDILDLDDMDFELSDPISAVESILDDEDDEGEPRPPKKK